MLRNLRSRRRPRYGVFVCVVVSCVVLLLWLSLLHRRGASAHSSSPVNYDSLVSDSGTDDFFAGEDTVDTIDALDVVEDQPQDLVDGDDEEDSLDQDAASSGYFFHHAEGVIRRAFSKSSIDDEERPFVVFGAAEDRSRTAFGSDDVAGEGKVRSKAIEVKGVEDALLLKTVMGRRVSPLREGWGDWFDKKADFLRKDKMLRSNLEGLNPLHNPILQDPDAVGLTGFTKADKILRTSLLHDLRRLPFPSRKITQHHSL
ncbi:uncharacterized protein At4g19900 [Cajanus cajan]|uniref:uncharacterized protein At4g19900 n=1 Tax=Cajanus cajan TaxID=3821 RepID=UPI00098D9015|nr:uncharacterized protein At4g19900 [Cajanus cajan]